MMMPFSMHECEYLENVTPFLCHYNYFSYFCKVEIAK